jgi:MinD-like ATPase involved in chromosome partitioning or flagellar assembly
MGESMDAGVPVVKRCPDSPITASFQQLADKLLETLQIEGPSAASEEEHTSSGDSDDPHHHPHHH